MIQSNSHITCPKCNHKIPRYTGARAQHFSCGSCSTYFSDIDHVIKVRGKFDKKVTARIPRGALATFDGVEYAVVGILMAKEVASIYYWNEYILYNPDHGYITLSEYSGHWNLVKSISPPQKKGSIYSYEGIKYELYSEYHMFYTGAEGEFTWDLMPKSDTKVSEYIAPPYSLLKDTQGHTIDWHLAKYISPKELKEAFKNSVKVDVISPKGTYSNMPNPFIEKAEAAWKYSLMALGLLILIAIIQSYAVPAERIFSEILTVDTIASRNTNAKSFVSQDFTVTSMTGYSSLRVILEAPVDNSWLEAEVSLINQSTDDEFSTEIGVEYYHGYEDGENWSEGGVSDDKILSMVPDGTYKLSITPHVESVMNYYSGPVVFKTKAFTVHIDQNTSISSNYVLMVLLILSYPIYAWIRKNAKETRRWANSEYGNN